MSKLRYAGSPFLYFGGQNYYFRKQLIAKFSSAIGTPEIKLSLRTGRHTLAIARASMINLIVEKIMEEVNSMSSLGLMTCQIWHGIISKEDLITLVRLLSLLLIPLPLSTYSAEKLS